MPPKRKSGNNLNAAREALAKLRKNQALPGAVEPPTAAVSEEPNEPPVHPAVAASPTADAPMLDGANTSTAVASSSASSALFEIASAPREIDEMPADAPKFVTAPLAGPSVASLPVDTAVWCRIDPVEVAAARAVLQVGIFDRSLASTLAAPDLPKLPRRPKDVVNAEEQDRRQAEFKRAYAAAKQEREAHAEQMAAREKQRAAELHRLRQQCLQRTSRIDLEERQRELEAVFPSRSFYKLKWDKPEELAALHLKHCCPPIDSPLWIRNSTRGWTHVPPPCFHHHQCETAACDRRRKLLGVARLAPHASAERCADWCKAEGWRDWTLLQIHRRAHGLPAPVLTCSRERCGCEAVTSAPPLKLRLPFELDSASDLSVDDYYYALAGRMNELAEKLEAQGVPVDREHVEQRLSEFRDRVDASDALFPCRHADISSYPFCYHRDMCLQCQVCTCIENGSPHSSPSLPRFAHLPLLPVCIVGEFELGR